MGLGSILGKIGGFALNAIPGVGPILGSLGTVLGGAASEGAQGKMTKEQAQLLRDKLNLDRYQVGAAMPGKRLATGTRAAFASAVPGNPYKTNWGGPGSGLRGEQMRVTGGPMEALGGNQNFRQLADEVLNQQLQMQLRSQVGPAEGGVVPEIAGAPKSSILDRILGGGALAGSILGIPGILGRPRSTVPGYGTVDPNDPFRGD